MHLDNYFIGKYLSQDSVEVSYNEKMHVIKLLKNIFPDMLKVSL